MKAPIRVLLGEDFQPFRQKIRSLLQNSPLSPTIFEASDGLEGATLSAQLQPDLIILDIGLPQLDGLQAAQKMRELSLQSKILFLIQQSSADVVAEAFRVGAIGFVVKTDAVELLAAIAAVLKHEQYISRNAKRL
ncbi:MAG TPA: response regulator transcription factor [Candidatus Sulfotelmatobacter sp.]|nr:response regulator transcription factor [Candidatus Sulfotelmatobacter sp.]